MKLREIREACEEFGSVGNAEQLKAAAPIIAEGLAAIKGTLALIRLTGVSLGKLNDKASKYALEHPTVFNDGLHTSPKGVVSGDLDVDGTTFHFASGYGEPKRIDGDAMSQEFLEGLPAAWIKSRLSINTTGINACGVTVDELEEKGLFRPAKNEWTIKNDASAVDDCDD